jgi:hypothetical protein
MFFADVLRLECCVCVLPHFRLEAMCALLCLHLVDAERKPRQYQAELILARQHSGLIGIHGHSNEAARGLKPQH